MVHVEKIIGTNDGDWDDIDVTLDPVFIGGKIQLCSLKVTFDDTATNDLTVTIQKGTDYSWVETTLSGAGTEMNWAPTKLFLADDEQVVLAWTNPNDDPDPALGWTYRAVFKKG